MPFVRRRPLAAIATAGAIALAAGCGGGGSSSLSADEFRTQADAICTDFNAQSAALADPTSPDQYLEALTKQLPIQQAQITELEALKPPSDLSGTFAEAIALLKQQTAALQTAVTRIKGGEDPTAVISDIGAKTSSLSDQADAKAKALGLTICGTSDGGTSTAPATSTAPTTATTDTAPATSTTASGTGGDDYIVDVQAAATALQGFGTVLSSSTGIDDLKDKVPEARQDLDDFDAAIAKLGTYTIEVPQLEKQRAGLVRTGPNVSDVLRRFLDAAAEGDLTKVTGLVPEVSKAIQEFSTAATAP